MDTNNNLPPKKLKSTEEIATLAKNSWHDILRNKNSFIAFLIIAQILLLFFELVKVINFTLWSITVWANFPLAAVITYMLMRDITKMPVLNKIGDIIIPKGRGITAAIMLATFALAIVISGMLFYIEILTDWGNFIVLPIPAIVVSLILNFVEAKKNITEKK